MDKPFPNGHSVRLENGVKVISKGRILRDTKDKKIIIKGMSEEDVLTIEEFLNLSKNAARVVKAADAVVKDTICRIIFLNFNVDEEKVVSYQLKEPFATLLKTRENHYGRGDTI